MTAYDYMLIVCAMFNFFMALILTTKNFWSAVFFKCLPFTVGLATLAAVFKPF